MDCSDSLNLWALLLSCTHGAYFVCALSKMVVGKYLTVLWGIPLEPIAVFYLLPVHGDLYHSNDPKSSLAEHLGRAAHQVRTAIFQFLQLCFYHRTRYSER